MPVKTPSLLQSVCRRGKLTLAQGCVLETEHVLFHAPCVAEAGDGVGGGRVSWQLSGVVFPPCFASWIWYQCSCERVAKLVLALYKYTPK